MARVIEIEKSDVEKHLTPEEMAANVTVRLMVTSKKGSKNSDGIRHYTGPYGKLPCDDSEAGIPSITKPVNGATVSYNGEDVKVLKSMSKWAIIEHANGQKRYVKHGHLAAAINAVAEETAETVEASIEQELVEA